METRICSNCFFFSISSIASWVPLLTQLPHFLHCCPMILPPVGSRLSHRLPQLGHLYTCFAIARPPLFARALNSVLPAAAPMAARLLDGIFNTAIFVVKYARATLCYLVTLLNAEGIASAIGPTLQGRACETRIDSTTWPEYSRAMSLRNRLWGRLPHHAARRVRGSSPIVTATSSWATRSVPLGRRSRGV